MHFLHFYERYFLSGSILIPIIIALFNYKLLGMPLKVILYFLVFSAVLQTVNMILSSQYIPNLFVFHFYAIFEFAFVSWFYSLQFKGLINKLIPPMVLTFAVLCVINFFYIQKKLEFNTYTRSLEAVIIIGYCVMFFNKQMQTNSKYKWGSLSLNWINTGLLIFYSCSFFIFMFSNYLLNANKHIITVVWSTYDTIIILENILFAIAFYKCRKQPIISLY
ncbi:hypothetical protein [Mucilaginibacter sp.]|uniref:hypothetical protein n=1 Tax=Mucilaginibacter sp. TaxID=1882438 RepID=UPI002602E5A1|nr:hypothetical protein [Mucilaginibacter sp.]MDB4926662.1 hypothetical protein [Mucilaginibacter sp.]